MYYYFIGYYIERSLPILLAVSKSQDILKGYLQNTRKLKKSQYYIDRIILDDESARDLYGDFIIIEYIDHVYITNKESEILDNEISVGFKRLGSLLTELKDYFYTICDNKNFANRLTSLEATIIGLEHDLTTEKRVKELQMDLICTSSVFIPDIYDYLYRIRQIKEESELDDMFRYAIKNDD